MKERERLETYMNGIDKILYAARAFWAEQSSRVYPAKHSHTPDSELHRPRPEHVLSSVVPVPTTQILAVAAMTIRAVSVTEQDTYLEAALPAVCDASTFC